MVEDVGRPPGRGVRAVEGRPGDHGVALVVGPDAGGEAPRRQLHVRPGEADVLPARDAQPGIPRGPRQHGLGQVDEVDSGELGPDDVGRTAGAAGDDDDLHRVVGLLVDDRPQRAPDPRAVVAGDDDRGERHVVRLGLLRRLPHRRQHRGPGLPGLPRRGLDVLGEVLVGEPEAAVGVHLGVLRHPFGAALRRGPGEVPDPDRRASPSVPRDGRGHRLEVQEAVRELLAGLPGEEPEDPPAGHLDAVLVVPGAVHPEAVREARERLLRQETSELAALGGVDPLVAVEGEDPMRLERSRRREQAATVLAVVPPQVGLAHRVGEDGDDQGVRLQDGPGAVRRPVVEGDHGVDERPHTVEVCREVARAVAHREQADEERPVGHVVAPRGPGQPSSASTRRATSASSHGWAWSAHAMDRS